MFRLAIALILVLTEGFFINIKAEESQVLSKITFDLSTISESGLIGTGTGVRSLAYEFCIPANPETEKEVRSIDPSLKIYRHSPGRIRCQKTQYLCIGETHQPKWREKLLNLANLAYIEKIQQFHGE
ncbi:hypothetical protein V0288_14740 [Pannus brasiliensis CCIBt3594]|uniref:Uncharacterized protein n=1 Tax=Pannus brasiliensis CCIBt3594 TaxID=1427578 RepID=A0AAW9QT13_9CHRO